MRILILGLGNTILTDDGAGIYAARRARKLLEDATELAGDGRIDVDVKEAEIAGFALLDLLDGYEKVVILDGFRAFGHSPGDIVTCDARQFESTTHLMSSHEVDLPTAIALGRLLGYKLPRSVTVIGIQTDDDQTLGDQCTPLVQRAIEPAARLAVNCACGVSEKGQTVS